MLSRALPGTGKGSLGCHSGLPLALYQAQQNVMWVFRRHCVGLSKVCADLFQNLCGLSQTLFQAPQGVVWGSGRHFEGLSNLFCTELFYTLLRTLPGVMHAYPTCCNGLPKVLRAAMADAACSFPRRYTGFF